MHLISSFLFAVSANIDSFIVGLSYGIKKSDISLSKCSLISFVTLTGTVSAILLGSKLSSVLPLSTTTLIGCSLLIILGVYYIVKSLRSLFSLNSQSKILKSSSLDSSCNSFSTSSLLPIKESILLGLTLSINNFGMGIGASLTGLKLIPTAIASFVVSIVFLYTGNIIGKKKLPPVTDRTADILSGIILVLLGIYELLS